MRGGRCKTPDGKTGNQQCSRGQDGVLPLHFRLTIAENQGNDRQQLFGLFVVQGPIYRMAAVGIQADHQRASLDPETRVLAHIEGKNRCVVIQ
ncbi:hypothetical protein AM385_27570 (plasmid) [Klebsiella pneumoniae]|nr:hypothetical protein AM385_27570 [Klebsiella pneumoniae]